LQTLEYLNRDQRVADDMPSTLRLSAQTARPSAVIRKPRRHMARS
jgi:hypothetical protein